MVIGDMPPPLPLVEEPRGPCGPFCMPLRTSIKPIVTSHCRDAAAPADWLYAKCHGNMVEITPLKRSHSSRFGSIEQKANDSEMSYRSMRSSFGCVVARAVATGTRRPIFRRPPEVRANVDQREQTNRDCT